LPRSPSHSAPQEKSGKLRVGGIRRRESGKPKSWARECWGGSRGFVSSGKIYSFLGNCRRDYFSYFQPVQTKDGPSSGFRAFGPVVLSAVCGGNFARLPYFHAENLPGKSWGGEFSLFVTVGEICSVWEVATAVLAVSIPLLQSGLGHYVILCFCRWFIRRFSSVVIGRVCV